MMVYYLNEESKACWFTTMQQKVCAQLDSTCYTEQIDHCLSKFDKRFQASRYIYVLPISRRC